MGTRSELAQLRKRVEELEKPALADVQKVYNASVVKSEPIPDRYAELAARVDRLIDHVVARKDRSFVKTSQRSTLWSTTLAEWEFKWSNVYGVTAAPPKSDTSLEQRVALLAEAVGYEWQPEETTTHTTPAGFRKVKKGAAK